MDVSVHRRTGSLSHPDSGGRRRQLTLLALFMVSVFNYVDRTILSILQIPIKTELGLSDEQMGVLSGLAFAVFYCGCAVPIARLADRRSRKNIILFALLFWSTMTAMMGLAAGFAMLILFRIGVALGEAGSVPASVSILSDNYPPARRARTMATWGLALPVGMMLGYSVTGWLAGEVGWRYTFAIIGGAGIILVPLLYVILSEPQRGRFDPPAIAADKQAPIMESLRILWRIKLYRYTVLAITLHGFSQYSMMSWNAPFFSRTHGMSLRDVSLLMAGLSGIGGAIGIYLGGHLADRLAIRDPRWWVWIMAIAVGTMVPAALIQFLVGSTSVAIIAASLAATLMVAYYGPLQAAALSAIPPGMRAFSTAVMGLVFNLVGLGLGPWFTGICSDMLNMHFGLGDESLRYALALSLIPSCAAAAVFVYAARFWAQDNRIKQTREKALT